MKIKHKLKNMNLLLYIFIIFFCLFSFLSFIPTYTNADNNEYSNVLDDLQKDENFNIEDYPTKEKDYSLQVIQVAESEDKELFIYVYQPGKDLNLYAKYINMSLSENIEETHIYTLKLINHSDTLYKYCVEGVLVSNEQTRYYSITSIYRKFIEGVDEESDYESQIIDYVPYSVAKMWKIETKDDELIYQCYDKEVVEIVDKYTGFVRYYGGFALFENHDCDSHFVAFSTDRDIDKLLSAKVYYEYQSFEHGHEKLPGVGPFYPEYENYGTPTPKEKVLNYDDDVNYKGNGWFAPTYEWKRIETVKEFFASVGDNEVFDYTLFNVAVESKIKEENRKILENMDYVLRFLETSYDKDLTGYGCFIDKTIVGKVSILELTFETDGKVYKLGVVDNMQSGPDDPFNDTNVKINIPWWVWLILSLVGLCLLGALFPIIFTFLWFVIKAIFKAIWWVIKLPFEVFKE